MPPSALAKPAQSLLVDRDGRRLIAARSRRSDSYERPRLYAALMISAQLDVRNGVDQHRAAVLPQHLQVASEVVERLHRLSVGIGEAVVDRRGAGNGERTCLRLRLPVDVQGGSSTGPANRHGPSVYKAKGGPGAYTLGGQQWSFISRSLTPKLDDLLTWMNENFDRWVEELPLVPTPSAYAKITEEIALSHPIQLRPQGKQVSRRFCEAGR